MAPPFIRKRFFLAVEGQSEQALVTWLQSHSELIHLDTIPLGGGGFKSMLQKAVQQHKRRCRIGPYEERFLILDGDRADNDGEWSIKKLRNEATVHKFTVVVQNPNHEGLLLRMISKSKREIPAARSSEAKLQRLWPEYQKPVNALTLKRRFLLDDLLGVAKEDSDFRTLLTRIGLMGK